MIGLDDGAKAFHLPDKKAFDAENERLFSRPGLIFSSSYPLYPDPTDFFLLRQGESAHILVGFLWTRCLRGELLL